MATDHGERFERIFMDEEMRKYLYRHNITPDNYQLHEEELRSFFRSDQEYHYFVNNYLTKTVIISCHDFLKPPQRIDLFLHPRYIQQSQHMHDFFEMKYQLTGSGTIHAGTEMLFLREGDICLISPYVMHSSEIYTDDAVMINIVIPAENLELLLPRIMKYPNPFHSFFSQKEQSGPISVNNQYMAVETDRNPDIRTLIQEMLAYYSTTKRRTLPSELQMESDLERIILLLLQRMPAIDPENSPEKETAKFSGTVLSDFIRNHLQNVTLADIADYLHFSQPYTSKYIRNKTGYSFSMILLILRMEEATRLLRETSWTVDRIAEEVGLSGKTNFYRQFQSFYGMSPAKYRGKT